MTRILVLGVTGMLGSQVFLTSKDTIGTTRNPLPDSFSQEEFPRKRIALYDAKDDPGELLDRVKPNAVINCIGIVKSLKVSDDVMVEFNGAFPHRLADACTVRNIRMIHISTDCVFSGKQGMHKENDTPDATDIYGKSKAEGEVTDNTHLTIRTSIMGRERAHGRGLVSWFLSNEKGSTIQGYTKTRWNGVTTRALAPILLELIHKDVTGILHVAGETITKFDLMTYFNTHFKRGLLIQPNNEVVYDRSLDHTKFDSLGLSVPPVEKMVEEMVQNDFKDV